jgi:uncharacterized cofD-like protein
MGNIDLLADKTPEMESEAFRVEGESRIAKTPGRVRRVHLQPNDPPAYPGAIRAILSADMIVIGPGSLFTSIIPNLLVPDLVKAIRAAQGFKLYVCNVATQVGETDGYDCGQHIEAIEQHVGQGLVEMIVANDNLAYNLPGQAAMVAPSIGKDDLIPLYSADLADPERPWRHDSKRLAGTLIDLLEERTGPLELSLGD